MLHTRDSRQATVRREMTTRAIFEINIGEFSDRAATPAPRPSLALSRKESLAPDWHRNCVQYCVQDMFCS